MAKKEKDGDVDFSWSEVADTKSTIGNDVTRIETDLSNKNMTGGIYAGENFAGTNFSMSNLKNADFSGADLRGCDFTGADLTGVNFEGANLEGANFSNAKMTDVNLTKANIKSFKIVDADIENIILIDVDIDDPGIENLQELIEYLAKFYPHKLNLRRINLQLLDLARIDLSKVSLRGVDFTGCSFIGVDIHGLDLSECIISPQQIAQALGRVPNQDELAKILAPKKKKHQAKGAAGVEMGGFLFDDGKEFGVFDATRDKGMSIEQILNAGKKLFRNSPAPPVVKDEAALGKIKEERDRGEKLDKEKVREIIEERKRQELEARAAKKKEEQEKEQNDKNDKSKSKSRDLGIMDLYRNDRGRGD